MLQQLIALIKKFISFPVSTRHYCSSKQIALMFAGYFLISIFLSPLILVMTWPLINKLFRHYNNPLVLKLSYFQVIHTLCLLLFISWLFVSPLKTKIKSIFNSSTHSPLHSLLVGIGNWFIAFPCVWLLYQILNAIHVGIFGATKSEQSAIRIVKVMSDHPISFLLGIINVVFMAPYIEEVFFRGFMHDFLRPKLGITSTIWVSSLIFALMHYSREQGSSNLVLLPCLLFFSLFLGRVYEKERSIWSSIGLHAAFNCFSVIGIFLLD